VTVIDSDSVNVGGMDIVMLTVIVVVSEPEGRLGVNVSLGRVKVLVTEGRVAVMEKVPVWVGIDMLAEMVSVPVSVIVSKVIVSETEWLLDGKVSVIDGEFEGSVKVALWLSVSLGIDMVPVADIEWDGRVSVNVVVLVIVGSVSVTECEVDIDGVIVKVWVSEAVIEGRVKDMVAVTVSVGRVVVPVRVAVALGMVRVWVMVRLMDGRVMVLVMVLVEVGKVRVLVTVVDTEGMVRVWVDVMVMVGRVSVLVRV